MGQATKRCTYTAKLTLPCGQKTDVDVLAVENLFLQSTLPLLMTIIDDIHATSVPLHSDYLYLGAETVEVLGVLSNDVL